MAAVGKAPDLSTDFDQQARMKISFAIRDFMPEFAGRPWPPTDLLQDVEYLLIREWGGGFAPGKLLDHLLRDASNEDVLDVLEVWFPAMRRVTAMIDAQDNFGGFVSDAARRQYAGLKDDYRSRINDILDDHGMAWQLVGDEIVPRESMVMHATVVGPVMALTSGDSKLARVEKAYQNALRELRPGGDPADAITDAGTALQEMLQAVGAKGNALGPLTSDARKNGLLGPYDSKLSEGFELIAEWVSADRSARGDTHNARDASRADAWLAVQVAGALILRLGEGNRT